ncbi:hypothetical protein V8Z80_16935 [Orrella sp. JC864]|uniref:hypothetical protein n=1 Tax=Orrella sp. JC864 TaxID=3120298 RepID=UPI003009D325
MTGTGRMEGTSALPAYGTATEAIAAGHGQFAHFYFHDNPDRSRILLLFNGAVSNPELRGRTVFHRWSWHQYFKHPVLCVADPLVCAPRSEASLAWFVGRQHSQDFPALIAEIRSIVGLVNPRAELIAMGSSGGGFAALMALACGYADSAIVINPQTDIELFERASAVARFKKEFCGNSRHRFTPAERRRTSVMEHGFARAKPGATIHYAQNMADAGHYTAHLLPFLSHLGTSRPDIRVSVQLYTDPDKGHLPPGFKDTARLFGPAIERLTRPGAASGTQPE